MDLRNNSMCLLFSGKEMSRLKLPTFFDVYRHFLTINEKQIVAINKTVDIINEIWHSSSLPHYNTKTSINKLKIYFDNVKSLKKSKSTKYYNTNYQKHQEKYEVLFDISICKCVELNACQCKREYRVPPIERSFLLDQRNKRELLIQTYSTEPTTIQSRKRPRIYASSSREMASSMLVITNIFNLKFLNVNS